MILANYSLYRCGTPDEIAAEMLRLGVKGFDPSLICAIALFSNQRCWSRIYDDAGCHWVWTGPNIPPWEMAERVFAAQFDGESRAKVLRQTAPDSSCETGGRK